MHNLCIICMHFYTNFAKNITIATFVKWNKSVIKYNVVCNAYVKYINKDTYHRNSMKYCLL